MIYSAKRRRGQRLAAPFDGPSASACCKQVTGGGASGGAAGAVATFKVVCKDSSNRRVMEGGASVLASITAKSLGAKEAGEEVAVLVKDNDDGSYNGMYTVSARGNYEVRCSRLARAPPPPPLALGALVSGCSCLAQCILPCRHLACLGT